MPRWPAVEMRARPRTRYIPSRVSRLPPRSALARSLLLRANTRSSSSSSRRRPALRATTRGVSSSSIQRASSAATKCRVPRIGQVRTIDRPAIARSTSASVALRVRSPIAQSAPR